METSNYLQKKKARLEETLSSFLSGEDSMVFAAMRYAVFSGGKRIRPLLLLATGEYFGLTEEILLPYACAIECIHNYSLIHDDLPAMDNDDIRRGQPTCHKIFGEALALLAGDGLLSLAFEILLSAPWPPGGPGLKEEVCHDIALATGPAGMIAGQWLDLSLDPGVTNIQAYEELARKKTAGLITVSAMSGARLAGASPVMVKALEDYGTKLGLAWQLKDDLEDIGQDTVPAGSFRPNLARHLGPQKTRELVNLWLSQSIEALRKAELNSNHLEYFASQLKFRSEKRP
ncbi:MAG TPA: polyprenyl synthetase family protein [Candidatus Saccharicenans sp.]|jgi:geranylgeranyl diphosphate synthase type II|nr:polyprenyl synthetase family protein [Candidatus Saccharicenans sp.]HRD02864.1 polyprenyl synthetase family protein [Candidatus Saccharicenans sp.]